MISLKYVSGSVKGPDPLGDDPNSFPARFFKDDMSDAERKEIVTKAYERLKVSLDKFLKPDGSKEAPGKTCGDIKYHHPGFESGEFKSAGSRIYCKIYYSIILFRSVD